MKPEQYTIHAGQISTTPEIPKFAFYCDADGVLIDYDSGIKALGYNVDPELKPLLNRSGSHHPLKREMYERIKGTDFYQFLALLPGAKQLYRAMGKPVILTAAPKFGADDSNYWRNPYWLGAAYHKRRCIEYHFHTNHTMEDEAFICTISAHKPLFIYHRAGKHQVLVDDRIANCNAWRDAGGIAVWHTNMVTTLALLEDLKNAVDPQPAVLA